MATFREEYVYRAGSLPRNIDRLENLFELVQSYPGWRTLDLLDKSELNSATFYELLKTLRAYRFVNRKNEPTFTPTESHFPLPPYITKRQMPPRDRKAVHIAHILSKCEDDETPVGFKHTKKQILAFIKEQLEKDVSLGTELIEGLQEHLALYALYTNQLEPWKHMHGYVAPMSEKDVAEAVKGLKNGNN